MIYILLAVVGALWLGYEVGFRKGYSNCRMNRYKFEKLKKEVEK